MRVFKGKGSKARYSVRRITLCGLFSFRQKAVTMGKTAKQRKEAMGVHRYLAKMLLEDLCYPASAAVSIGASGEVLGVHLFDTMLCGERMRLIPDAAAYWLISGHADGVLPPYEEDWENLRRMRQMAGGRPVRLFLAGEYHGCVEIAMPRGAGEA